MFPRIRSSFGMLAATRRGLNLLALAIWLLGAGVYASRAVYSPPTLSSLSIDSTSVVEGDGAGTVNLNFTVTLSPPDMMQTVTVDFRTSTTAENVATFGSSFAATASPDAGADYVSQMGTLTFNPGDTSKPISITVNSDCVPENTESMRVFLSNAMNANISTGIGQGQITTDDLRSLDINNASVVEGDSGTTTLSFTVTLSGSPVTPGSVAACGAVTVDYRTSTTAENAATYGSSFAATASPDAGADYVSQMGTLTFNPGDTSKPISITVNSDCVPENTEFMRVFLSNAMNANISTGIGQGQITTDDLRSLDINNASVVEGDSGTTTLSFTVTLSGSPVTPGSVAACGAVTVDYRTSTTAENAATYGSSFAATASPDAGADYVSQMGTLTFNPGDTSKPISITVNSDCVPENTEFMRVFLSNAMNANISTGIGQGQITTDDLRSLDINSASVTEGAGVTVNLDFTVTLTGSPVTPGSVAACGAVTVDYRTSTTAENIATYGSSFAATASPDPGADYVSQMGTLTFNVGETTKTISITVNPDNLMENDEFLRVFLSNAQNANIGAGTGTGTIHDGPSFIQLEEFTATAYDTGVLLEWRTGFEVDNLGFNIFREENGNRSRVNPRLVAGSALLVGPGTRLRAGYAYSWNDLAPGGLDAVYWLEDVDLKGQSTWHGPFRVRKAEGSRQKAGLARQSATLDELNDGAPADTSSPLEAKAHTPRITAASIGAQGELTSQAAAKIAIKHEGWYRVTQSELAAIGFNTRVNPRLLQLFVDGLELPIVVRGEQDGSFDLGDSVEFYGIGLDSAFTDSRVYWLLAGDQAGLRVNQKRTEGAPSSSQSFTATVERRDRNVYFSSLRNGENENFFGALISRDPVDQQLALTHLAGANSGDATVEIALQGVALSAHRLRVELNGAQLGEVIFDGQSEGASRFNVPHSLLREGINTVRLTPLASGSDVSLVDYIRITYQHSYTADNNELKLAAPGGQQITIDGSATESIRVFDVTDANSPEELTGDIKEQTTGYAVTFASRGEGQRLLLASTSDQRAASLSLNQPSNLRKGKASYLIITRRDFFDSLQPLVALRESQGLRVSVVDIEDIYDEFSFGQKSPLAIRDFLANAKSNWKKKPRFVLFAGDASLDPKNYLGHGDADLVPTKLIDTDFMETASDDWFSDFDGNGLPEIATGRLPARTAEELSRMISKITSYEQSSPSDEALLVADANEGFDFERATTELRSLIPARLRITQINRGRLDPEMARRSLFEALYRKQFLVNYAGHGSVNQWKADLLTNDDALALGNNHLPTFVMMTCLNGYFQDPALDSLAESLLKAQGGAAAVWASSGMTLPQHQAEMNRTLYRLIFAGTLTQPLTLGDAIRSTKSETSNLDVRRTWILLGDPAMRLR